MPALFTPRQAGILSLAAGALILFSQVTQLVIPLVLPESFWIATQSFRMGGALVAMFLLLLALTALFARQASSIGRLGFVGYVTAALGTLLVAGNWWYETFIGPVLREQAPELLATAPSGSILIGAAVTSVTFAVGWTIFGIATIRARILPRPGAILLVVGGAMGILGLIAPFQLPLAIAVGSLGWALLFVGTVASWPGRRCRRPRRADPRLAPSADAGHLAVHIPFRVSIGDLSTPVMLLLAARQAELDLGPAAVVDVQPEGHDRLPLLARPPDQLVDLRAVEQQLPFALGLVVAALGRCLLERRDVGADQPRLAVAVDARIRIGQVDLVGANRLDLGAGQCEAGLHGLVDRIFMSGSPVQGDGFAHGSPRGKHERRPVKGRRPIAASPPAGANRLDGHLLRGGDALVF